jgi:uncharacterized protein
MRTASHVISLIGSLIRSPIGSMIFLLLVLAAPATSFAGVIGIRDLRDPRPAGWVVDQAGVLDEGAEQRLTASLAALHTEIGAELAVVAVDDVRGTPKAFATELFNTWRLGSAERNDGVLVLLVVGQRRLEIETGDGMQAQLTAAWLAELQRAEMVPYFKRGDLAGGLVAGTAAMIARLRQPPGEQDAPDAPGAYRSDGTLTTPASGEPAARTALATGPTSDAGATEPTRAPSEPSRGWQLLLGLGGVGGVGVAGAFVLRRRSRKCRTCGAGRSALDEEADDAHLTPGQRAEEKIGSMQHTILFCPTCQSFEHRSRNLFFTGRSACAGCKHRTALTETKVLRSPTYESSGRAQVTATCSFCPHTSSTTHALARLTRSTSSSSSYGSSSSSSSRSSYGSSSSSSSRSSSSSSSGGGRSSGGGSGSSW